MNKLNISLLATLIGMGLSANAMAADSLIEFTSGTAAKASEVNANFEYLEDKIDAVSASVSTSLDSIVQIDCDSNADALKDYLYGLRTVDDLTLEVTGACNGPVEIFKDDVVIEGVSNASITSSYDSSENELEEAVSVAGRTNITLKNLTINEGLIWADRGAYIRLENVVLPSPHSYIEDSETLYVPNVEARFSNIRFESGSINNLALGAAHGSYVRISKNMTGTATYVDLSQNTAMQVKVTDFAVSEGIAIFQNASFFAGDMTISTGPLWLGVNASFEVSSLTSSGFIGVYQGASIAVENGDLTARAMECHGGHIYVDGNFEMTGVHSESGGNSLELAHGCTGEISGNATTSGSVDANSRDSAVAYNDHADFFGGW